MNEYLENQLNKSVVYQQLKDNCERNNQHEVLALVAKVGTFAVERLKTVIKNMPEFTLHDDTHIFNMLTIIGKLIPQENMRKLSTPDLFMLIVSVFLHDIGMAPDEKHILAWKNQLPETEYDEELKEERENIVKYCRKLIQADLTKGTGGNISILNREKNLFAISPSGMDYFEMEAEDVVVLDLDAKIVDGKRKPSSEFELHRIFYTKRNDINAHLYQSGAITLSPIQKKPLLRNSTPTSPGPARRNLNHMYAHWSCSIKCNYNNSISFCQSTKQTKTIFLQPENSHFSCLL